MKKISILFSLFLNLSLLQAQSIWEQVNPMPPLVDFNDVHFINTQEGWACGEDGVLIHTTNGAQTWNQVNTLLNDDISGVWFVDSLTGYICGEEVLKTGDGGKTWERVYGYYQPDYNFSLYFENQDTGWVTTQSGKLVKTMDGGSSWTEYQTPDSWMQQMYPMDNEKIWARSRSKLMISNNGGVDWEVKIDYLYSGNDLNDFYFLDEMRGWVVGDGGLFFQTLDGGLNWDTIANAPNGDIWAVRFYDEMNGFIYVNTACYKTTNGATTWEEIESYPPLNPPTEVTYPIDSFICVAGSERLNFTWNMGESWQEVNNGIIHNLNAVTTSNFKQFAIGNMETIMISNDTGDTWEIVNSGLSYNLQDIAYVNSQNIWIVGHSGRVLFSSNDGLDWTPFSLGTTKNLNAISMAGDFGIIAGSDGVCYRTLDGGDNWLIMSQPYLAVYAEVQVLENGLAWIVGSDGYILKTENFGETWATQNSGTDRDLHTVYFSNADSGWVAGSGIIQFSSDGGINWLKQWASNSYNYKMFSIRFNKSNNGWACGRNGFALHTGDGGINWIPQNFTQESDLFDFIFTDQNSAICVGEGGLIYKTNEAMYLAPKIMDQSNDTSLCEGEPFSLVIEAIGDSLHYQWYKTDMPIEGATNASYIINSTGIFDGGIYYCEVFNGAGLIKSDDIMMSVKPKAMVVSGPDDISAYDGDTVIFNQSVVGALPIGYQWQKDGVDIPGAVFHTYTIYNVGPDDIGDYRSIVSNECHTDTSATAKLEVSPGPGVDESPAGWPFNVVPNPAATVLTITLDQNSIISACSILTLHGDVLYNHERKIGGSFTIPVDQLSPGPYILKVSTGDRSYGYKFIRN